MMHLDPHGAIIRAARWAEEHHKPTGLPVDTWTILYEIAGRVAAGALDVSDMPADICGWSDLLWYLDTKRIDVILEACRRAGIEPTRTFQNGVQKWPPLDPHAPTGCEPSPSGYPPTRASPSGRGTPPP
jgi:hypothetical protein